LFPVGEALASKARAHAPAVDPPAALTAELSDESEI
jgi:hypothetical protein